MLSLQRSVQSWPLLRSTRAEDCGGAYHPQLRSQNGRQAKAYVAKFQLAFSNCTTIKHYPLVQGAPNLRLKLSRSEYQEVSIQRAEGIYPTR